MNSKIKTGQVEVQVSNISIINKSETPPFSINEENQNVDENIRLKIPLFRFKTSRVGTNIQNETSNNTRYS